MDDAPPPPPDRDSRKRTAALVAAATVAAVVLTAGIVVWLANRGGDELSSGPIVTVPPSSTASPVATTTPPDASTPPTTAAPTSVPATVASTTPPSTAPPRPALPEPGATSWVVTSDFEPIAPEMTLELAATDGDVRVFDGVREQLRCVGVVGPGEAVTTWCGAENTATGFVADRGSEPVVIELGAETGVATIRPQPGTWTLASNGCSASLATILGGVDPGGLPVTGIACRGDDAFIGVGMALFGPGVAPDGGGILATLGDEGWNVVDFGTSISCDGLPDGVDRCAAFGVTSELFEALLPIPPLDVLGTTSTDVVAVSDRTTDVEAWIGDESDADAIVTIVTEQLVDPEAEAPATVRRSDPLDFGRRELVIVEIPQLDDSIATETWAIWIGTSDETRGVTAFSWSTCARGVTGDGVCV